MATDATRSSRRIQAVQAGIQKEEMAFASATTSIRILLASPTLDADKLFEEASELRQALDDYETLLRGRAERNDPAVTPIITRWVASRDPYFKIVQAATDRFASSFPDNADYVIDSLVKFPFKVSYQVPRKSKATAKEQPDSGSLTGGLPGSQPAPTLPCATIATSLTGGASGDGNEDEGDDNAAEPEEEEAALDSTNDNFADAEDGAGGDGDHVGLSARPKRKTMGPEPSTTTQEETQATEAGTQPAPKAASVYSVGTTMAHVPMPTDQNDPAKLALYVERSMKRLDQHLDEFKKREDSRTLQRIRNYVDQYADLEANILRIIDHGNNTKGNKAIDEGTADLSGAYMDYSTSMNEAKALLDYEPFDIDQEKPEGNPSARVDEWTQSQQNHPGGASVSNQPPPAATTSTEKQPTVATVPTEPTVAPKSSKTSYFQFLREQVQKAEQKGWQIEASSDSDDSEVEEVERESSKLPRRRQEQPAAKSGRNTAVPPRTENAGVKGATANAPKQQRVPGFDGFNLYGQPHVTGGGLNPYAPPFMPPIHVTVQQPTDDPIRNRMLAQDALDAIPIFTGKFEEYPGWRTVAKTYSEVKGPADTTRLNALKNKLGEAAKKIVQGITALDPTAIDHFFELLDKEYGREEALIDSQRKRIFSLAAPKVQYADMRDFVATLNEAINTLQYVNHPIWTDRDVRNAVYDKLPQHWRNAYTEAQLKKCRDRRLRTLLSFIEFKTQALYYSQPASSTSTTMSTSTESKKDSAKPNDTKKPEKKDSTKAFSTTATGDLFCECCEETGHEMPTCPKFTKMHRDQRLRFVCGTKIHFRCLTKHQGKPCPIPRNEQQCPADQECRHSHHAMLHGASYPYRARRNYDDRPDRRRDGDHRRDGDDHRPDEHRRGNPPVHRQVEQQRPAEQQPPPQANQPQGAGAPQRPQVVPRRASDQAHASMAIAGVSTWYPAKNHTLRLLKIFIRAHNARGRGKRVDAMIDGGCTRTIVDEKTIRSLGVALNLRPEDLGTLHGMDANPKSDVTFEISRDGKTWFVVRNALTIKPLKLTGSEFRWSEFKAKYSEFAKVDVDDVCFDDVKLLLGAELEDLWLPLYGREQWIHSEEGILAYETKLGWTIGGKMLQGSIETKCHLAISGMQSPEWFERLTTELRRFNDIEALGVEPMKTKLSRKAEREQRQLDETTTHDGERFTVPMLWKGKFGYVPPSERNAQDRLLSLHRTLDKKKIRQQYAKTISDDLQKGYVKKLNQDEAKKLRESLHWFLPHFVVLHPDKPDRPRRVLDCAARSGGVNLNSFLNTGPNNLADLWGVLLRFRVFEHVINADITEMFPQVRVADEDQNMLAFLWNEDPTKEPDVYVNLRHVFGGKCSPSIANHAVRRAARRFSEKLEEIVKRHFYMDDFYFGAFDIATLVTVAKEIAQALEECGFKLRKWASNSTEILRHFPEEEIAPAFRDIQDKLDSTSLPTTKALGTRWDAQADTLGFSSRLKPEQPKDRADVLRQLAMQYDLLQIVGPWIMKGKLLFQAIQLQTQDWKTPLTTEQAFEWISWISDLPRVAKISIPRWFGIKDQEPATLSVFSDSSLKGYGAVGFLVSASNERAFVAAKGRVLNPKKLPTVPRGELQALVLGTRLGSSIIEELGTLVNITRVIFWTDSIVVFWWMRNEDKTYKEFVGNRIAEISTTTDRLQALNPSIRWVDTKSNPADLISRGLDGDSMLDQQKFWLEGPAFLTEPEETWPQPPLPPDSEEDVEVRKCTALAIVASDTIFDDPSLETIFDLCKRLANDGVVTTNDIKATEEELVKMAQEQAFDSERKELKKIQEELGDEEPRLATKLFKKGPLQRKEVLLDENGLLRLVTRAAGAEFLSWEEKYPLLLPTKHAITRFIIRDRHVHATHAGTKTTYALLAKQFYVPISAVKQALFWCERCRRRAPLPVNLPQANLHANRLGLGGPVFQFTGMDHFGPFEIRRRKKCWGLLFICLTTRAVHLEVCEDLTVPVWLNAIDRFIARRGKPAKIFSDRSTTFVGGGKVFNRLSREFLNDDFFAGLAAELVRNFTIDFEVIPAGTPHYGGSWERMIREAKRCLVRSASTINRLSYDALVTFLTRAEGILNQRPLAIDDDGRVLTPAHILAPASTMGYQVGPQQSFARVLGQLKQAVRHFWKTWTDFYLKMTSADRFSGRSPMFVNLQAGDKVLCPPKARGGAFGRQELGVAEVISVLPSADGRTRQVTIRDSDNEERRVVASRLQLTEEQVLRRRT